MINVNCFTCGISFLTQPNRLEDGRGKYCSMTCRSVQRKHPTIPCPTCGKIFHPNNTHKQYCSRRCVNTHPHIMDPIERFWSYVEKSRSENGCWLWIGHKDKMGYGKFTIVIDGKQKHLRSHRFSFELANKEIAIGSLNICHRCDNPPCVRPDHLFLGTHADNIKDKVAKKRQARGVINGRAKVTDEDIIMIRSRITSGEKLIDVAHDYHISFSNVSMIANRITWKHVP